MEIGIFATLQLPHPSLVQSQETCEAMGAQGARPPAGARGVPALSLFPQRLADDALVQKVYTKKHLYRKPIGQYIYG